MTRTRSEFAAAIVALVLGAGAVLLLSTRDWQTVTAHRPRPFQDLVVGVAGRTVDGAPTALALVGLAGVVAVVATKGLARRVIGALTAVAGVALIWRCSTAMQELPTNRATDLVGSTRRVTVSGSSTLTVTTHPLWAVLSIVAAVLVVAAGVLIALRGGSWAGLSARYQSPVGAEADEARTAQQAGADEPLDDAEEERARARADAALWGALERGDDPTAHDPGEPR